MVPTSDLTVQRTGSGYLVHLQGRGTVHESPAIRQFVSEALREGAEVVLDLSDCEYLDSTLLGCLVVLHRCSNNQPGCFSVVCDASRCYRLFSATRLEKILRRIDEPPPVIGEPVILPIHPLPRQELGDHLYETHSELARLGGPEGASFRAIADQLARELNER